MSHPETLPDLPNATSSPASAAGPTLSDLQECLTALESGREAALASLSPRQAKAMGLMTSGTCGQPSTISSASASLESFLVNRLQVATRTLGSTLYKLTWKPWAMPSGRSRFRLRASVPRTSETVPTGWATPAARDYRHANAKPWSERGGGKKGEQLNNQVVHLAGWPTPAVGNSKGSQSFEGLSATGKTPDGRKVAVALPHVAKLAGWPTPTAQTPNSLRGKGQDPMKRRAQGHTVNLTDAIHYIDRERPARLTASGEMLTGSSAGMQSGGQLDPAHSCWLMGYPEEWGFSEDTETPSTPGPRKRSSKQPD